MEVAAEGVATATEPAQSPRHTSAHTDARNRLGRATAMTVANPIKPRRTWVLKLNFWLTRRLPILLERLQKLSFIHFCRWTIVYDFPYNGPPQQKENLRYKYLFFLSNYNGYWMQYIDAFANVLPDRLDKIWIHTYGYPPGAPADALKKAIRKNEYASSHYYSAYPEASRTMISSALELKGRFEEFDRQAAAAHSDEDFRRAFLQFLTESQRHL
jgi:hypothetical protein